MLALICREIDFFRYASIDACVMTTLDVPERAIQAFEQIHGLRVTVHDLRGSLNSAIAADRFQHTHAICQCVKVAGGAQRCFVFEVLRLRAEIHAAAHGRYHICHAGMVEWIVPVYHGLELEWVIFAGVRTPGSGLAAAHREPVTRWQRPPWKADALMPKPVDSREAGLILEHLLQLGARLYNWAHDEHQSPGLSHRKDTLTASNPITRRRILIRQFIEANAATDLRLTDLAQQLHVSEDRTTHLVRECCGTTFRDMLIEARLKRARELLLFSSSPILEVALSSGFNEISHFNRLFRRRTGCSPGHYRRNIKVKC